MALINITFGEKNKINKNKADKLNKPKKKKEHYQHTKIILNIIITLTVITTMSSIYINYKNGFSLDGIVTAIIDAFKWIVPCGISKSFFETKEKEKIRLEYLKAGLKDEYESRDDI